MHQTYRANLTAAEFPLLTSLQGRTIIVSDIDQNFSRQTASVRNHDRDIGIPQIYYMHNVLPVDAGVVSVGYKQISAAAAGSPTTFGNTFFIRDSSDNYAYFNSAEGGINYVLNSSGIGWVQTTSVTVVSGTIVTTANVNGESYIYFGKLGCYKYNFTTNVLTSVTLLGLDPTKILGICASSGYMIAWTKNTVLFSSIVSPTDFVPSLVNGSGGGGVQSVKAEITVCLPHNNGFVIYSKKNAVSAVYTGNPQYPFSYKEIPGCGGLVDYSLAAFDGNSTDHFSYTTSGLQQVSMNSSVIVHPQITDFISGSVFEDFDETTNTFLEQKLRVPMRKKVVLVSNRYLVISYGVTQLTHAMVYDIADGRWGKLKVQHVDCFEYLYPAIDAVEAPKRSIAFVQADGTVLTAVISFDLSLASGIVLCGKYQLDRNSYLMLHQIDVESVGEDSVFEVTLLSSIDGTNVVAEKQTSMTTAGKFRKINCRKTALNHSILFKGSFVLHSLELKFSNAGRVR